MSKQLDWNQIDGVVLDAVGTLIKPTPSVALAYAEAAARQGLNLNPDDVRKRFRSAFGDDSIQGDRGIYSTDEDVEHRRWRAIVAGVLPEIPDPDRAFDELWDHFGRPEAWTCFPDAAPAIKAVLKAGLKVCIGSNFDSRLRGVIAGLPELAPIIDDPVISSEVGFRKPHEAFFEAVANRLDLPPNRILSVGDDLENDVSGARRAGLWTVHVHRGGDSAEGGASASDLVAVMESRAGSLKFIGRV